MRQPSAALDLIGATQMPGPTQRRDPTPRRARAEESTTPWGEAKAVDARTAGVRPLDPGHGHGQGVFLHGRLGHIGQQGAADRLEQANARTAGWTMVQMRRNGQARAVGQRAGGITG